MLAAIFEIILYVLLGITLVGSILEGQFVPALLCSLGLFFLFSKTKLWLVSRVSFFVFLRRQRNVYIACFLCFMIAGMSLPQSEVVTRYESSPSQANNKPRETQSNGLDLSQMVAKMDEEIYKACTITAGLSGRLILASPETADVLNPILKLTTALSQAYIEKRRAEGMTPEYEKFLGNQLANELRVITARLNAGDESAQSGYLDLCMRVAE